MNLTTFLALLVGLDFVTASPVPTAIAARPSWALLKRGIDLSWQSAQPYKNSRKRKLLWEEKCHEALVKAGCDVGIIQPGSTTFTKTDGQITHYINLEGAQSTEMMKNPKKIRVYLDGTSEEMSDWPRKDQIAMLRAKRVPKTKIGQPLTDQKALLFWDPPNAYHNQRKRKVFWEQRCDAALAREGCEGGTIHKGEAKRAKPNGGKVYYVRVEGAPPPGTEYGKKLRVFEDGSSEDGWSKRDVGGMARAKLGKKPKTDLQPFSSQKAILSWNPPTSYVYHPQRRVFWANRCDEALTREGCKVGTIHKGETRVTKLGGKETSYVRVEGAESPGMEYETKLRVFQDGSSEVGWDERDSKLILRAKAKRPLPQRHRKSGMLPMSPLLGPSTSTGEYIKDSSNSKRPMEAISGTEKNFQDSSKRQRVGGSEAFME